MSVGSSRSSASSPVTSEDLSVHLSTMPNLDPTSPNYSADRYIETSNVSTLLKHSNSSHSTIKKSQSAFNSLPHNPLQPLPTHAEDESDTASIELSALSPDKPLPNPTSKHQVLTPSSHPSTPAIKPGAVKPHPLAIHSSLPSSISHPQIRTPSRTKRRSIGSVMSERIGPFEDANPDLATPTSNQARLSTSSLMTVVIDYAGALKATTQAPLLSPEDMALLKSLSPLGFDTGQIIHSVQSYACDSSGALWWLLKRKFEKQDVSRDDLERNSSGTSNNNTPNNPNPLDSQPTPPVKSSPVPSGIDPSASLALVEPSAVSYPTMSITAPEEVSSTVSLPSISEASRSSSPSKRKSPIPSANKGDSSLYLAKVDTEATKEGPTVSEHRSKSNSKGGTTCSKNTSALNVLSFNLHDDGYSSSSSLKAETPLGSDKEAVCISIEPVSLGKKSIADLRKRSHSVSMLQRATHALATKKATDDKHLKTRSREGSSTNESDDKHGQEKTSKKDLKAREKDSKVEDHSKSSVTLPLSGLFSRKASLLPPLPSIPVGLMLPSLAADKPSDKSIVKLKELDLPADNRSTVSMPSSPSASHEAHLTPKNDSDSALNVFENNSLRSGTPSASVSFSSSTAAPSGVSFSPSDPFCTPKPHFSSVKSTFSAPSSKYDECRSLREPSPAVSSLAEATGRHKPNPSDIGTAKSSRNKVPKSNLFSNFKFWFNEDRRKRKQNMTVVANYNNVKSPTTRIESRSSSLSEGAASPIPKSHLVSDFHVRKLQGDSHTVRSAGASTVMNRRTSKSSRRSSIQSSRRVSLELTHPSKSASKRRSGSSRASFGSITGNRTPSSEPGSYMSGSQQVLNFDGSGPIRTHETHVRHTSLSSSGSRRSSALQHLSPSHLTINSAYLRPTSSAGTTVRRVTAPVNSATASSRHRPPKKASSLTSSVRTSMSSDDGSKSMSRRTSGGTDDHRMHSPMNGHDVDETIEEEDDGEEQDEDIQSVITDHESGLDADVARRSAFQKLSGATIGKDLPRANVDGTSTNHSASGGGTRTIFMAHKPHSVFGTPTQAFFARSTQSPIATKFSNTHGSGNGAGPSYVTLMKSIADGPTSRKIEQPKIRDVFASKTKEDGEWVDLDDDDDGSSRYEGGIGQGVTSRNGEPATERSGVGVDVQKVMNFGKLDSKLAPKESLKKNGSYNPTQVAGYGLVMGQVPSSALGSPTVSSSLAPTGVGNSSAAGLIGNWRGGNPRVTSNFKSIAIEEEEEEE